MANEKRLIDANEAVKLLRGKCVAKYPSTFAMGLFASADEISKMPTVDAAEVVHGRWEHKKHKLFGNTYDYVCSACGCDYALAEYNYCPNCGAKMDGEEA